LLLNTRRKIWPEGIVFLLTSLVLIIIGWGCNTRDAGCLNPDANNFDLNAERDCDGCCTFPALSLTLSQKWDTRNFLTTDTFFDLNQQPYQIVDIQYFLSSWTWKSVDDNVFTVDSTTADCAGQDLKYTPDINLIEPRLFVYPLGTFRIAPQMDTVTFHLGLVEDFSCLDDTLSTTPAILTPASPLWNPATQALSSIRLIVNRNIMDTIFDTVFIDLHHPFTVPYSYEFKRGANYSFSLTVNYALWFQQVRIEDLNSFPSSIAQGLEGSFSRTQ
jgi:hypothetical protein